MRDVLDELRTLRVVYPHLGGLGDAIAEIERLRARAGRLAASHALLVEVARLVASPGAEDMAHMIDPNEDGPALLDVLTGIISERDRLRVLAAEVPDAPP